MAFDIRVEHPQDTGDSIVRCEPPEYIQRVLQRYKSEYEHQTRTDGDMVVRLRLALMITLFEKKGYLDREYIDQIIRQVIQNFKNKHHIKALDKRYGEHLTRLAKYAVALASRAEPEQEPEPCDIDDDDIDAWLNSTLEE